MTHIPSRGQEQLYLEPLLHTYENGEELRVDATAMDSPEAIAALVTRHQARYYLVGHFCRAGMEVLDFPCGSGYAARLLAPQQIRYTGYDNHSHAIQYATLKYGTHGHFALNDLTRPRLAAEEYDVIGCIEGLEHIGKDEQRLLIFALHDALKPGGVLVISSPETCQAVSGPNPKNPYHKHELTKGDFLELMYSAFRNVELITQRDVLDTGEEHVCLYAACRKVL